MILKLDKLTCRLSRSVPVIVSYRLGSARLCADVWYSTPWREGAGVAVESFQDYVVCVLVVDNLGREGVGRG